MILQAAGMHHLQAIYFMVELWYWHLSILSSSGERQQKLQFKA
jgi:hypothetical protein